MNMADRVWELLEFANSRTKLVKGSMASANGTTTLLSADLGRAVAQELTDVDIIQFALTLEHLEANMYQQMLAMPWASTKDAAYIQSFADHEAAHVEALTNALIAADVKPVMAMDTYNFPPLNSRDSMLN